MTGRPGRAHVTRTTRDSVRSGGMITAGRRRRVTPRCSRRGGRQRVGKADVLPNVGSPPAPVPS
eukprot:13011696-Heterocapsa_arctica.AAC.1